MGAEDNMIPPAEVNGSFDLHKSIWSVYGTECHKPIWSIYGEFQLALAPIMLRIVPF
jgi:hypothetical protein